ncbi:MAG: hypothetical protein WBL68_07700, partial [Nitrososphaeraceae archaeon]
VSYGAPFSFVMIVKIAAAIKSSLVALQRLCFSHLAFYTQVSDLFKRSPLISIPNSDVCA